jgi:flagellar hook-associated protein 1 FlgK
VNNLHNIASNPGAAYDVQGNVGGDFFDVTTTAGNTAALISLNISDTNKIAASSSATRPSDNSNASAIAQLQNKSIAFATGLATFNSYYDSLVSKVGLDVQSAKNTVSQDNAFTQQLTTLRESNSGVSLDEELTNLVKYQRSYQASAKLISTATDMMDTVIGLIN